MLAFISIIISWLLAVVCWVPLGSFVLEKLDADIGESTVDHFILSLATGAALCASVLSILSLVIPINAVVSCILALLSASILRHELKNSILALWQMICNWSVLSLLGFSALALICLLTTSLPIGHNDSGLYYIQFMEWLINYPAIPGLANLHDRLGFNSSWHLLNAAFNVREIGLCNTNDLSALLMIVVGLASFDRISKRSEAYQNNLSLWVIFPITFFLLLRFLTSTAPDLPATVLPFIYLSYFAKKRSKSSMPLLILLIGFASTVKLLSAIHLIAIIPLLYWTLKRNNQKQLLTAIIIGLIVTAPWLVRNVVQTGYLIFPLESVDLFHFDWKVPAQVVSNTRKMVDVHARFGNYELSGYGQPIREWFGFWMGAQSKTVLLFFILAISSSLLLLLKSSVDLVKSVDRDKALVQIFLVLTLMTSLVFWWNSGPNPRFIYAIVLFMFSYSLRELITNLKLGRFVRPMPFFGLMLTFWIFNIVKSEPVPSKPEQFGTIEGLEPRVAYPLGTDKCWNQPIPCSNDNKPHLHWRTGKVKDGFRSD